MNTENNPDLNIDPAFQRLFQPVCRTDNETARILEQQPELRVLPVWNNILLGDYNIFRICSEHSLPCEFRKVSFRSVYKAGSHVCSDQLTRTDLTPEYQKFLVGKKFLFEEKQLQLQKKKGNNKNQLAISIGTAQHLSYGTVLKYSLYAAAVDYIYDASDSLAARILLSRLRVSHENVLELARLTPEELKKVAQTVQDEDISHLSFQDIRIAVKGKYTREKAAISRREKEQKESESRQKASIRQMPAYDPDAEVNSLCMTISSWVSSIERVNRSADYSSITGKALYELIRKLTILEETIKAMQKKLVERENR